MSQVSLRYRLGDDEVGRVGYGAMQLAGPGVFGPPKDEARAIQVLRDAIAAGVRHIDTSDFYGPHLTNQLIKKALHPYPEDLIIVTKVGARRDEKGGWLPAFSPGELVSAVEDNLRNLDLGVLEVVNLRSMLNPQKPTEGSLEPQLRALMDLKEQGVIRHIGLSNVTARQVEEAQQLTEIACVQNLYNLANREDDALIDQLATPMQVALAWLLQRSPNILLIPGTSSPEHLRENLAAAQLTLPDEALAALDDIGNKKGR